MLACGRRKGESIYIGEFSKITVSNITKNKCSLIVDEVTRTFNYDETYTLLPDVEIVIKHDRSNRVVICFRAPIHISILREELVSCSKT